MSTKSSLNRRGFIKTIGQTAACAGFAAAFPTIVPSYVFGEDAPSEKITAGIIGLGWRGNDLLNQTRRNPKVQIAAISDLDRPYLLRAQKILDDEYGVDRVLIEGNGGSMKRAKMPEKAVEGYVHYEQLLERKDIDAVLIAVPDHCTPKPTLMPCAPGKMSMVKNPFPWH